MAIKKSFGGATIYSPGAYSRFSVDNSSGPALESNDTILLVGESTKGEPGSSAGYVEFTASRLRSLIETYGKGPLVDCALAAAKPANRAGIGGAGRIIVWKTNESTQASAKLSNSNGDLYTIKDRAYGVEGNDLSIIVEAGSTANQKSISVSRLGGTTEDLGENTATAILDIQYTGDASTANATISGASRSALTLDTTLAGDQTDGSADLSISLSSYTMKQLVDFINQQTGYLATLNSVANSQKSATELDPVTVADIKTSAQDLFRLQYELLELINESDRVLAELESTPIEDLPDNTTGTQLTGGAQGASANSDFSDGFTKSLSQEYNVLLPCVSRDASDDIADTEQGFTDASSSYDIASILASANSHLRVRESVKNRREAQGFGGVRDSSKSAAFSAVSTVGSELMQVGIQDVLVVNSEGTLEYKHPHVFAALCAGIRLGTAVGEPLTHKFINALQIGHAIDPATGQSDGDFDPQLDADNAIINGVLFADPVQGGIRIHVDNTTYGIDDSFIFNRGSVVEAAQFVFKTLRETAEQVFVGQKVSNGIARSIKEVVRNRLRELNAPDVQIITASSDAPQGFVEETFTVEVQGNTATVSVEFKPVQGLDFVFFDFTIGDISQSA